MVIVEFVDFEKIDGQTNKHTNKQTNKQKTDKPKETNMTDYPIDAEGAYNQESVQELDPTRPLFLSFFLNIT